MHKNLSADNTPIGWIEMYLGLEMMFQKGANHSPIG
jgi:hypothetical protein